MNFEIGRALVQTWQFRAVCVLAALVLLAIGIRWRLRQVVARERVRHDDRLRERERIAREMHDTLLQSTQGFVLKVQAAANLVPGGTVARQMLEDALLKADTIMTEGRDRIQSLRTLGVEPCDLPEALERLGGALSGDGSQHTVQIEGDARTLNASVADEVYQIAREAMTNAFRHAKAKSVETQLVYGNDMLRLRVRDDGRGFDPAAFGETRISGHWGLTSMRERAEGMGAKLVIRSHLGVGTDIELVVPAQSAYG